MKILYLPRKSCGLLFASDTLVVNDCSSPSRDLQSKRLNDIVKGRVKYPCV